MTDRIFTPLGMTSAGFGPQQQLWSHQGGKKSDGTTATYQPEWNRDNAEALGPAGRVHCSMEDWSKYVAWTLRAMREDTPLLSRAIQQQLLTFSFSESNPAHHYAGGWLLTDRSWAGGLTLTHAGSNTGNYCVAWLAPKKKFAVLAACNAGDEQARQACDRVASELIGTR